MKTEAVGSLHPLEKSVLKVPLHCRQESQFIGLIEQMPNPVNGYYWLKIIREVDQTLLPFKERLEWASTLTFWAPAHHTTMGRIRRRPRTDQNLFLASRQHEFVLFSRNGMHSDGRHTFVEVHGQRLKLTTWLAMSAAKRAQLWHGRVLA
jgi:hypothetical protein